MAGVAGLEEQFVRQGAGPLIVAEESPDVSLQYGAVAPAAAVSKRNRLPI
jgi:hypothetical protein